MVEKVSDRARRRITKSAGATTTARLRSQEAVNQADRPDNVIQAEKAPKPNQAINYTGAQNPKSKKVAQKGKTAPTAARRFVASHKKGGVAVLAVILVVAVLFIGSIVVSGPMQFMQFTSLVKNSIQFMSDSITSTRVMRDVLDIAQGASYTPGSTDARDIGGFGRLVTDYYKKNLATRGVEFSGGDIVTLNLKVRYAQDSFDENKTKTRVSDEFNISTDAITYHGSDKTITIDTSKFKDDSSKGLRESENFLRTLDGDVNNFATKELSSTRRLMSTRRIGLDTWLHTISHADQVELRKTMTHLEAWYVTRLAKMTGQELRVNGEFKDEVAAELREVLDPKMAKRIIGIDTEDIEANESDSWMMLALAMACVNRRALSQSGSVASLYSRVIMPAIMEALTTRSIEGQIHSISLNTTSTGFQDFTFDDLAGPAQDYFFDDLESSSGEKVPVSGWSSAPVKAALGDKINELDMARTVDYALRFLELRTEVSGADNPNNPAKVVGDKIDDICDEFFDTANDLLGKLSFDDAVLGWIKTKFNPEEVYWAKTNRDIGNYSLQTFSMDPAQKLSTAMYGSKFFEDYDNTLLGGRVLTEAEVADVYNDSQANLASEYQAKSIVEKLFDPADYRSGLATIARASNWDTAAASPLSHLANVAKTFARLPSLTLASVGAVFSKSADAASTNSYYDYGTGWYGYSNQERQELNSVNSQTTIFANAKNFYGLINGAGMKVNLASIDCFSTQITKGGILGNKVYNVIGGQSLLNSDGSFNRYYMAGTGLSYYDCHSFSLSDSDMLLLRAYLLDYNLMAAGACFLAVAYPDEEFDDDGNSSKTYGDFLNSACGAFL
jgi:hypothetical protein